jgi:hypothetical protein
VVQSACCQPTRVVPMMMAIPWPTGVWLACCGNEHCKRIKQVSRCDKAEVRNQVVNRKQHPDVSSTASGAPGRSTIVPFQHN